MRVYSRIITMGNARSRTKSKPDPVPTFVFTGADTSDPYPDEPVVMAKEHSVSMDSIVATNSTDSGSNKSANRSTRSRLKSSDGVTDFVDIVVPHVWKTVFSSTHLTICMWKELVTEAQNADKEMHAATSSSRRNRIRNDKGYPGMDKRAYPAMLLIKAHILKDHARSDRWAITDMPESHTDLDHAKLIEKVNSTVLVYQRANIKMSWLIEVRSNKECKRAKIRISALEYGDIACALSAAGWPDDCISSDFNGIDRTIFKELDCETHGVNRLIVQVSDDFKNYPIDEMEKDMEKIAAILH